MRQDCFDLEAMYADGKFCMISGSLVLLTREKHLKVLHVLFNTGSVKRESLMKEGQKNL